MKLIPFPTPGTTGSYTSLIYNCTRNSQCQPYFSVPIYYVSELYIYVDLPGRPDVIDLYAIPTCGAVVEGEFNDDFNDDFNIGGDGFPNRNFVYYKYVVGQKPDGTWYAVFTQLVNELGSDFRTEVPCFIIGLTASIGGLNYEFFSEEICHEYCGNLTMVEACMPPDATETGFDLNDIYYGLPQGDAGLVLGNPLIRYFHRYYVRSGQVIEKSNRVAFKNNLVRSFKSEVIRQYEFRSEFVPTFYKDYILAAMARGNVKIGNANMLTVDTELELVDEDMQWWKPVFQLEKTQKQFFGCAEICAHDPFPGFILDITVYGGLVTTCGQDIVEADFDEMITNLNGGIPLTCGGVEPVWSIESWNPAVLSVAPTITPTGDNIHYTIRPDVEFFSPVEIFKYRATCADGSYAIGSVYVAAVTCDEVCTWGTCHQFDADLQFDGMFFDLTLNYNFVDTGDCDVDIDGFEFAVVEAGQDNYQPTFPFVHPITVVAPAVSSTIVEDLQQGAYDVWVRLICSTGDNQYSAWRKVATVYPVGEGAGLPVKWHVGYSQSIVGACGHNGIVYTSAPSIIEVGAMLYMDLALTIPLIGYTMLRDHNGLIWNINWSTGEVMSATTNTCY